MRCAVSVSLGSSTRDHEAEIDLLGERVHLRRVGTDGDVPRAARMLRELDGTVDALGLGGGAFGLRMGSAYYPLHAARPLRSAVRRTPFVDGSALKQVLERRVACLVDGLLHESSAPRRAFLTVAIETWELTAALLAAGYDCIFGDLAVTLRVPIAVRSAEAGGRVARWLMPVLGRVPIGWLYPTGSRQHERRPRCRAWFEWATVVAGNFHYLHRHMPSRLEGKIVCTNTTTSDDVAWLRNAGIRHLVTTTPVLAGRTFGTNLIEAALLAAVGATRPLPATEIDALVQRTGLAPAHRTLDPAP